MDCGRTVGDVMARHSISVLAALFLFFPGHALANGPFGEFYIGGWKVAAYTNDANRTFSHCAAAAQYESGTYFLVSVDIGMSWSLGFVDASWQLLKGEMTIPIDLTFDGRRQFHVYGEVIDPTFVKVQMSVESDLIKRLPPSRLTIQRTAKGSLHRAALAKWWTAK
jgi:hypothetical protein